MTQKIERHLALSRYRESCARVSQIRGDSMSLLHHQSPQNAPSEIGFACIEMASVKCRKFRVGCSNI